MKNELSRRICPSTDEIPDELAQILIEGDAMWVPGVKINKNDSQSDQYEGKQIGVGAPHAERTVSLPHELESACRGMKPFEPFTFIELFAGIGGFRVGLERLGGQAVFAAEIDVEAAETYHANFGVFPAGNGIVDPA